MSNIEQLTNQAVQNFQYSQQEFQQGKHKEGIARMFNAAMTFYEIYRQTHQHIIEFEKSVDGVVIMSLKAGIYAVIKQIYDEVMALSPDDYATFVACGKIQFGAYSSQNWDLFVKCAQRGIASGEKLLSIKDNEIFVNERLYEIYNNLGIYNKNKGQYNEAKQFYDKSAIALRKLYDSKGAQKEILEGIAYCDLNLGGLHVSMGNFDLAKKHLERADDNCQKNQFNKCRIMVFSQLGTLYADKGDWANAAKYYEEQFNYAKQHGSEMDLGSAYNNMGQVHHHHYKDKEKARNDFNLGLQIARQYNDTKRISYLENNLAALEETLDAQIKGYLKALESTLPKGERLAYKAGVVKCPDCKKDISVDIMGEQAMIMITCPECKSRSSLYVNAEDKVYQIQAIGTDRYDKGSLKIEVKKGIAESYEFAPRALDLIESIAFLYRDKYDEDHGVNDLVNAIDYTSQSIHLRRALGDNLGGSWYDIIIRRINLLLSWLILLKKLDPWKARKYLDEMMTIASDDANMESQIPTSILRGFEVSCPSCRHINNVEVDENLAAMVNCKDCNSQFSVVYDKDAKEFYTNIVKEEFKKLTECPRCFSKVELDSRFCVNCGFNFKNKKCSRCFFENFQDSTECKQCGADLTIEVKETKQCSACDTKNDLSAKICSKCGQNLSLIKCKSCKTDNQVYFRFCEQCGNELVRWVDLITSKTEEKIAYIGGRQRDDIMVIMPEGAISTTNRMKSSEIKWSKEETKPQAAPSMRMEVKDLSSYKVISEEAEALAEIEKYLKNQLIIVDEIDYEAFGGYIIENNHVVKLGLDIEDLTKLPESVCQLMNLTFLSIKYNNLTDLPECMKKLEKLELLDIRSNKFKNLPNILLSLKNLKRLKFSSESFEEYPSIIDQLEKQGVQIDDTEKSFVKTNLASKMKITPGGTSRPAMRMETKEVSEYNVQREEAEVLQEIEKIVKKSIPLVEYGEEDAFFGYITKNNTVTELGLDHCELEIFPETIIKLKNLEILSLLDNKLSSLPASLSEATKLKHLDLRHNRFEKIPEVLVTLPNLKALRTYSNPFKEKPEQGLIDKLIAKGIHPGELNFLKGLKKEEKQATPSMRMEVVEESEPSMRMEVKDLSSYKVISEEAEVLYEIEKIIKKSIPLVEYGVNKAFFGYITENNSVVELGLDHCELESFPESIIKLKKLQYLSLLNNKLDALPASLSEMSTLSFLDLRHNHFKKIPDVILSLKNLKNTLLYSDSFKEYPEQELLNKLIAKGIPLEGLKFFEELKKEEKQATPSMRMEVQEDKTDKFKHLQVDFLQRYQSNSAFTAIRFSQEDNLLLAATISGTVYLIDLESKAIKSEFNVGLSISNIINILNIQWLKKSNEILLTDFNGNSCELNGESLQRVRKMFLDLNPTATPAILSKTGDFLVYPKSRTVNIYDLKKNTLNGIVIKSEIKVLSLSPDERSIAVLNDMGTQVEVKTFPELNPIKNIPTNYRSELISWSPDGKWIAVGTQHGRLLIIDSSSFKLIKDIILGAKTTESSIGMITVNVQNTVRQIKWSPDGEWICAGTYMGYYGIFKAGDSSFEEVKYQIYNTKSSFLAMEWSGDGKYLATSVQKYFDLWEINVQFFKAIEDKELYNSAQNFFKEGKYNEAIEVYNKVLTGNPENIEIMLKLVKASMKINQFGLALEFCDKIHAINADYAKAMSLKAICLAHKGEKDSAESITKRLKQNHPDVLYSFDEIGLAFLENNLLDLAQKEFLYVLERDNKNGSAWYHMGLYYEKAAEVNKKKKKEFLSIAFKCHLIAVNHLRYYEGNEATNALGRKTKVPKALPDFLEKLIPPFPPS